MRIGAWTATQQLLDYARISERRSPNGETAPITAVINFDDARANANGVTQLKELIVGHRRGSTEATPSWAAPRRQAAIDDWLTGLDVCNYSSEELSLLKTILRAADRARSDDPHLRSENVLRDRVIEKLRENGQPFHFAPHHYVESA